jgi:plastocyanin
VVARDTLAALAVGAVLLVAVAGTVLGFGALAGGGLLLDEDDAGTDGGGAPHNGGGHTETGDHQPGGHDGGGASGHDSDSGADDHGGGMDNGGGMMMDMRMVGNGTVVNGNAETLPPGCTEVAGERSVTVHGGVRHADGGEMYSFERDRLELDRCTRVTVTFENEDDVRHQWMLHGLPTSVYPMGMFNVEVDGPGSVTGTFITPGDDVTLDTHCSLPQHEQKGMQMTVVVGEGGDDPGGH